MRANKFNDNNNKDTSGKENKIYKKAQMSDEIETQLLKLNPNLVIINLSEIEDAVMKFNANIRKELKYVNNSNNKNDNNSDGINCNVATISVNDCINYYKPVYYQIREPIVFNASAPVGSCLFSKPNDLGNNNSKISNKRNSKRLIRCVGCNDTYYDWETHCQSETHQNYVKDQSNFVEFDALCAKINNELKNDLKSKIEETKQIIPSMLDHLKSNANSCDIDTDSHEIKIQTQMNNMNTCSNNNGYNNDNINSTNNLNGTVTNQITTDSINSNKINNNNYSLDFHNLCLNYPYIPFKLDSKYTELLAYLKWKRYKYYTNRNNDKNSI